MSRLGFGRLAAWFERTGDQFWIKPALLVTLGVICGEASVWAEQAGWTGGTTGLGAWIYRGGESGARSLLSAIASSTIGVAGTTFSITVAALSLASGQMGPRLLRNFVRDPGNQIVLGIFLGTFAYALSVLRAVRSTAEGETLVPHLGVSGALLLALLCVGTLIWFVHHIALSINVETVIAAVHRDLGEAILRLTDETPSPPRPEGLPKGRPIALDKGGYLQALDAEALADWMEETGASAAVEARPGHYIPAGLPIAEVSGDAEGAEEALSRTMTFGPRPIALQDLEFSIRQLTEVAVRALSPGINDPFTAAAVLDRLGGSLCEVAPRHLPTGVVLRDGRVVLVAATPDYAGLCDAMFHTIRQNAAGSAFVLIRLVEVLTQVAMIERNEARRAELRRHADLALALGREVLKDEAGLADLAARHARFREAVAD